MTKTSRSNPMVKAMQTYLNAKSKNAIFNKEALANQRKMIGADNNRNGNWTLEQLRQYCETSLEVLGNGATKIAYGSEDLAVCFIKANASKGLGNQIKSQVDAWKRISVTEDYIYFNPVLSYGAHRGDKLSTTDNRYLYASFIVSPKAHLSHDLTACIEDMFYRNRINPTPAMIDNYRNNLIQAARRYNIHDLHGENIGVVYDRDMCEWRAVIIDYAL